MFDVRTTLSQPRCQAVAAALLLLLPALSRAHESPEDEARALTAQMLKTGRTPALLGRRAAEYKALGQLDKAASDITEAIKLDPKDAWAYAELSKIQFAQEKLKDAYDNATRSLGLMEEGADRGPVYLLRAQIHAAFCLLNDALADCEFADRKDDLDWYLTRSQVQAQLHKLDERVTGLKAGYDRNVSIVLEIEWIEAMIDAGQFRAALERIDHHLNQLRLRSSWLLRRARALKGLKRDFLPDVQGALTELQHRINPERPEPTLLLDRAMAYALLGKADLAQADLTAAKKHGLTASNCVRVEAVLKAAAESSQTAAAN